MSAYVFYISVFVGGSRTRFYFSTFADINKKDFAYSYQQEDAMPTVSALGALIALIVAIFLILKKSHQPMVC